MNQNIFVFKSFLLPSGFFSYEIFLFNDFSVVKSGFPFVSEIA